MLQGTEFEWEEYLTDALLSRVVAVAAAVVVVVLGVRVTLRHHCAVATRTHTLKVTLFRAGAGFMTFTLKTYFLFQGTRRQQH